MRSKVGYISNSIKITNELINDLFQLSVLLSNIHALRKPSRDFNSTIPYLRFAVFKRNIGVRIL